MAEPGGHTEGAVEAGGRVRKILHIDMDAFYASVEQRDNPELRGKPVAVGGSAARGVVAAASYEARVFGVRSAMPSVTAKRRCPDLIFVKPRFEIYRAVSAQIREVFAEHTDLIEPLSLDEAYLDVTENKQGIPIATEVARIIRNRIKEVTGLNASAGISYCKFLAKMASDLNKPNGQAVITPARGPQFVAELPVKKFHGVGPATAAKMERLGILTGADLREKSPEFLRQHFGKSGDWYYRISRGIGHRPVEPHRERKSIGAEDTFSEDIFTLDPARAEIEALADKVWRSCEAKALTGRTVTLKVKYADFQQITRSRPLGRSVRDTDELAGVASTLLEPLFPVEKGIRLLGVTLSSLEAQGEEPAVRQLSLGLPGLQEQGKRMRRKDEERVAAKLAKAMAMICVRNTMLENIHAGRVPRTKSGDYSDVFVVDAEGNRIPWREVSHIDDDEMRDLMRQVVNRLYTFHLRIEEPEFQAFVDRWLVPAGKWDEPVLELGLGSTRFPEP